MLVTSGRARAAASAGAMRIWDSAGVASPAPRLLFLSSKSAKRNPNAQGPQCVSRARPAAGALGADLPSCGKTRCHACLGNNETPPCHQTRRRFVTELQGVTSRLCGCKEWGQLTAWDSRLRATRPLRPDLYHTHGTFTETNFLSDYLLIPELDRKIWRRKTIIDG